MTKFALARINASGIAYARTCSYSSYGGLHDLMGKNVLGERCQHPHSRKLRLWATREAAERNRRDGEQVVEVGMTNDELRAEVRHAFYEDAMLADVVRFIRQKKQG